MDNDSRGKVLIAGNTSGQTLWTIMESALECGFGSKSAFNEIFMEGAGMTPIDWRRRLPAGGK